jgi:DNA primase
LKAMDETGIEMSNPEKRIFAKYTKKNLVGYYRKIAGFMLPHIQGRPHLIHRQGWNRLQGKIHREILSEIV